MKAQSAAPLPHAHPFAVTPHPSLLPPVSPLTQGVPSASAHTLSLSLTHT